MAKASDNQFPKVTFAEGSAPSTPSTGLGLLYEKTDGKPYFKNDGGTEYDLTQGTGGTPTFSGARVYDASNQSLTEDTLTAIAFDSESFDSDSYHDTVTDNTRLTVSEAGYYLVYGQALFDNPVGGATEYEQVSVRIRVDGTTTIASATQGPTPGGDNWSLAVKDIVNLSANSYVELMGRQRNSSSAAEDILGGTSNTFFLIHKLGT